MFGLVAPRWDSEGVGVQGKGDGEGGGNQPQLDILINGK